MSFNNADHLLTGHVGSTCSWESKSTDAYDATDGDETETFAAAVTLNCMQSNPSNRWVLTYPELAHDGSIELWLPKTNTVAVEDKITFNSQEWRVIAKDTWTVINQVVLCQRWGTDD